MGFEFGVELIRPVEMRARIDRPLAVVRHVAAPEDDAAIGIAGLQFQPHVEGIHGAGREEVADLPGSDHHVHARGFAGFEHRARGVNGRRNLAHFPDQRRGGLFGFLAHGESGVGCDRVIGAAAAWLARP